MAPLSFYNVPENGILEGWPPDFHYYTRKWDFERLASLSYFNMPENGIFGGLCLLSSIIMPEDRILGVLHPCLALKCQKTGCCGTDHPVFPYGARKRDLGRARLCKKMVCPIM